MASLPVITTSYPNKKADKQNGGYEDRASSGEAVSSAVFESCRQPVMIPESLIDGEIKYHASMDSNIHCLKENNRMYVSKIDYLKEHVFCCVLLKFHTVSYI